MTDRRDLGIGVLFDPEWHWLAAATDLLYREVEVGTVIASCAILTQAPDGTVVSYTTHRQTPGEISRRIITDTSVLGEMQQLLDRSSVDVSAPRDLGDQA